MKKGASEIFYNIIIPLILALIIIILLARGVYYRLALAKEEAQAESQLDFIVKEMKEIEKGQNTLIPVIVPRKWFFVYSEEIYGKQICLCKKEDCKERKCRGIEVRIKEEKKERIPFDMIVLRNDIFDIAFIKFKKYRPSKIEIDNFFEERYPELVGLGQCIKDAAKETDVPESIIIAVMLHESRGGESKLAKEANNLFGVKGEGYKIETRECLSEEEARGEEIVRICKKEEAIDCGEKICYVIKDEFVRYDDKCQSIVSFARLIATRYREALEEEDEEDIVREIAKARYSTDPRWSEKIIKRMEEIA